KKYFAGAFVLVLSLLLVSCDDGKVNIFTVEDDIQMGREITEEILANPEEYPILDEAEYPAAYQHIRRIRDNVLASGDQSGELRFKDQFDWNVYIIDQEVLNAFALPGGNTFYYTGLIKYLEDEASFAGVMAHEFAHCDRRHSTNRMTKIYGYQVVLSMILGNDPTLAAQIAADLALGLRALAFSREDEYEADEYAVKFMYPNELDSRGVAYFFEQMELEEGSDWMIYFSTHPHPDDRIEKIYEHHQALGGEEGDLHTERYQDFKNSLP
ncbi:MAG: M48 family metalloprotease, partial [Bacteroidota bacterium]